MGSLSTINKLQRKMRSLFKFLLPPGLRFMLRITWIRVWDILTGKRFRFAKNSPRKLDEGRKYAEHITIAQRINISQWAENKKHNLKLAVATFQNLPILPGEIFSFWFYVGRPTEKAGYKVGINIIQGKLDFDVGGGLCQLSGLLYHLALSAGLEILERHPHSVDLYTDETRYTPLGADATTAFGYKDLRLKNSLDTPVSFRIRIEDQFLVGSLCAPQPLLAREVIFRKQVLGRTEVVETLRETSGGEYERLCTQTYAISDHDQVI